MDDIEETQIMPVHPAVEMLLARMETNPDEFKGGGKWNRIYEPYKGYWNDTEKKRVKDKLREIHMGVMHEELMKKLVEEPKQAANRMQLPLPLLDTANSKRLSF